MTPTDADRALARTVFDTYCDKDCATASKMTACFSVMANTIAQAHDEGAKAMKEKAARLLEAKHYRTLASAIRALQTGKGS